MSSPVRFKPSADRDVESAFVWYEEQRPGLGDEFLEEVGSAVTRIAENSHAHQSFAAESEEQSSIVFRTSSSS